MLVLAAAASEESEDGVPDAGVDGDEELALNEEVHIYLNFNYIVTHIMLERFTAKRFTCKQLPCYNSQDRNINIQDVFEISIHFLLLVNLKSIKRYA